MSRIAALASTVLLLGGLAVPLSAQALFSDDEARRAIVDLRGRVEIQNRKIEEIAARMEERTTQLAQRLDRLEQTARGQLELQSQIEALRDELAKLRGQFEVQNNELTQMQRRQREVLADLDNRLKPFEPTQIELDGNTFTVEPDERRAFEGALKQFRAGEFAQAIASFQQLRNRWPSSGYVPYAMFWTGSAQFAMKDYKAAIATQQALLAKFPDHPRAPDALLSLGVAQADSGDKKSARKSFETVVQKYPDAQAAQLARERLAGLR